MSHGLSPVPVSTALREAADRLAAMSGTARLDAEVLMAHALGVTRSEMLLRHMREVAPREFDRLVERRMRAAPIAHITGSQEFWGLDFRVTPDVLIPRADSETMVRAALAAAPRTRRVLDLGVGSGALLLSVLSELPQARGTGIDKSEAARAVAASNAERLGLAGRATMMRGDWTQPGWTAGLGQFDLILANPPYVEDGAELDPQVRDHEPHLALFAGPEGLDAYRVLIPQLPALLAPKGTALVEIGATQAEAVSAIAEAAGFAATLHRDLADRPRVLELVHGN